MINQSIVSKDSVLVSFGLNKFLLILQYKNNHKYLNLLILKIQKFVEKIYATEDKVYSDKHAEPVCSQNQKTINVIFDPGSSVLCKTDT